jgi:signal transduction histidine kinase
MLNHTRTSRRFMAFGAAILLVAAALALRIIWWPVLQNDSPFLFFFAALALASWYGGLLPGVLATVLGACSVVFLNLLPVSSATSIDTSHLLQYSIFVATGVLISFLMEKLHAAIDRSVRTEHELEKRVQERTAELVQANTALQNVSSELLNAQETERLRVSKELHDDLGQALTLIKLKVGLIDASLTGSTHLIKKYCEDASAHVDQAIENMRRLSRDLSPVLVETLGPTIALRRLADEFNSAGGVEIKAEIAPIDSLLPLHSSILLYRILQEGLNNIVKHSGASAASLAIIQNDGVIHFELKDNGKGFDLDERSLAKESISGGFGLAIMLERVRTLGGSLAVESREGAGTKLYFSFPVQGKTETEWQSP